MTKLLILSLVLLPAFASANEGKTCAAIKSCEVTQVSKSGRKKSTSKNKLNFDYLCDADVHSLPLKGGMELELAIVKKQVVAALKDGGKALTTKKAALDAKKLVIKFRAKQEGQASVEIACRQ
jgi:hypothetical protein